MCFLRMGFDIERCVGDTGSRILFLSSDQLGLILRSYSDERVEGLTKSFVCGSHTLLFAGLEAVENWFEGTYIFDVME